VTDAPARLFPWLEAVLAGGVLVSAAVLLGGLALGRPGLLHLGLVLLILTPVARVVAVTAGFALARDWTFAALALTVLAVLATGAWIGLGAHR
jgi:uncharacterized membrane protein